MIRGNRRSAGVFALLFATGLYWACNAGTRIGAEEGKAVAAAGAEPAPAPEAAKEGAKEAAEASPPEEKKAADKASAYAPDPSNPCVTSQCHTKILAGTTVHDAAEPCDGCHEEASTPHPAKGKKTFKLTDKMPDLCSTCHDSFGTAKTVHSPVADGDCTECHDPHSSSQPHLLKQPVSELCKSCHESQADAKFLHDPIENGDCTDCHTPHESKTPSLLLKEQPALCIECHVAMEDELKKKNVHDPVSSGECTECHNPHGAKHEKLLEDLPPELCFSCHETVKDTVNDSSESHAAMDDPAGCLLCHSPHASDNDTLLLKPQKEVCAECHDDVSQNMAVLHGPDNDGKCSRCHSPHGSDIGSLLVKEFPAAKYVPYTETAYPLCFSCHKRELAAEAKTTSATGFRDGDRNLHALHVADPDKGRSCRFCHDVHGSTGPMLIRDSAAFGKWKLPLKFVKTDTGGGCSPGCHQPKYYDRDKPGRKPSAAAAEPSIR